MRGREVTDLPKDRPSPNIGRTQGKSTHEGPHTIYKYLSYKPRDHIAK